MSRKWERMVEKNKKTLNKQRAKQGKLPISEAGRETMQAFKGRSWFFPALLVAFSLFFLLAFGQAYGYNSSYYLTGFSYLVLGLLIFWIRRPVLRIGQSKISSRRFTGDKTVEAAEIEQMSLLPGYVVIEFKEGKSKWIFSKTIHLMPLQQLHEPIRQFAKRNGVPLKDEIVV